MSEVKRITTITAALIAALSMTFAGDASAADRVYVYPSTTFDERAGLLLASANARRFRTDCPMYALYNHDNFEQRRERAAKFIDELGADAVTIAQLNAAIEGHISVLAATPKPGSTGNEKYCGQALREIAWFGRLR